MLFLAAMQRRPQNPFVGAERFKKARGSDLRLRFPFDIASNKNRETNQ
jgi:hypothetical protein